MEWTGAFQVASVVKYLLAKAEDARDMVSIPGLGRSPGVRNGNPFQYSCLENFLDSRAQGLQFTGSQREGHNWAPIHNHRLNKQQILTEKHRKPYSISCDTPEWKRMWKIMPIFICWAKHFYLWNTSQSFTMPFLLVCPKSDQAVLPAFFFLTVPLHALCCSKGLLLAYITITFILLDALLQGHCQTRYQTHVSLCFLHWQAGSLQLVPYGIVSL